MRVLVLRVGAMGDVLHALPAVTALREAHPAWTIDWVVDPRWSPLLVGGTAQQLGQVGPVVSAVHLAETQLWKRAPFSRQTLHSIAGLRRSLRRERYDLAVDLQGTLRSAAIGRMARTGGLAGYGDPREALALRFYSQRVPREGAHVVEQCAHLLGTACGDVLAPAVQVPLPHDARADVWAEAQTIAERPLVVLAAAAGWGAKQWPVERFAELARWLAGRGFDPVVNAPRPGDTVATALVGASGGAARALVCDVAGLCALLRRATLAIGGDTGPVHLAAALGVPVLALFGPTDPARNGPWGPGATRVLRSPASRTSYRKSATPDAGLASITLAEVVAAAGDLLRMGQ